MVNKLITSSRSTTCFQYSRKSSLPLEGRQYLSRCSRTDRQCLCEGSERRYTRHPVHLSEYGTLDYKHNSYFKL
jgi:hypothetical protein